MKKIVINTCYGGFGLSELAWDILKHLGVEEDRSFELQRDNHFLVWIVEELGEQAEGPFSQLKVVEIPEDVEWQIETYDGLEWIAEKHRTWN